MKRTRPPSGYYHYAAGERVPLIIERDWLAVDSRRLDSAEFAKRRQSALRNGSKALNRDVFLVKRKAVPALELAFLERIGAIHPVFRSKGALVVALPEVRVEESTPRRLKALRDWLEQHGDMAEVVQERGGRIDLRPTSGRGLDALTLANLLSEQVGPEMAQTRFLRVVERMGHELQSIAD